MAKLAKGMTRRMKTLMLSCMTIMLCVMIMVAGSFALFSSDSKMTSHLVAGELNAKLERVALKTKTLNESGYLVTAEDDEPVDFTAETTENVFGLVEGDLVVPQTELSATMKLSNNGAVAFGYWLEIKAQEGYADTELAKQMKVTVTDEDGNQLAEPQYLSEGLTLGSAEVPVDVLEVGEDATTFVVTILFEDREDNNAAQNSETIFDLIVHAAQVTDAPSA